MSIITFAVLTAVGLESGYANAYLEKTSIAVMKVSKHLLGGNSGNRSICRRSSGPRSHSGKLVSSGVIRVLLMRLS